MEQRISEFIEQYVLKSGEKVGNIIEDGHLYTIIIVKHSARIYRKVAQVKVAQQITDQINIPQAFKKYKWTIFAKREVKESFETTYDWLTKGLMMQEIRYHKDGISVKESFHRMGPAYYYITLGEKEDAKKDYQERLDQIYKQATDLSMPKEFQEAMVINSMPNHWGSEKKVQFIHFCIAFFLLSKEKDLFDFKEIGATYDQRIGGSKIFDVHRDDFLTYLKQFDIAVEAYGLVSMGTIVPIFFTGDAQSELATYRIGAVHAMTDTTVLHTTFATSNRVLWLVENRAILTRLAVEVDFLRETNSFVISLDGQIKSPHKQLIKQLLNSSIEQVLVWTDYDAAGVTIAKHAVEILSCPYKIIGRHGKTFTSIEAYEQSYLEEGNHEQEQQLGDVQQWKSWI